MKTKTKPSVLFLIGAPGSGKSTFATGVLEKDTSKKIVVLSRDNYRKSLMNSYIPDRRFEMLITELFYADLKICLDMKYSVIIDNTNVKLTDIKAILKQIEGKAQISYKIFDVDKETLLERNKTRGEKSVPVNVIDRMTENLNAMDKAALDVAVAEANKTTERIIKYEDKNPDLPDAIIVDIDGTLAHMNGKRGPFDWKKVDVDDPDIKVIDLVRRYAPTHKVIIVSGRDGSCEELTRKWLLNNGVPHDDLLMRPAGDYRKDSLIKAEIYNDKIKGKYNIEFVLDDRQQVVNTWRSFGLKVLQVEPGNF